MPTFKQIQNLQNKTAKCSFEALQDKMSQSAATGNVIREKAAFVAAQKREHLF